MGASANILEFKEQFRPATLVLVDLHREADGAEGVDRQGNGFCLALDKCRMALAHARLAGFPVAFVRHKPPSSSLLATQSYAAWLDGFIPHRSDMVFERALPSCYASTEFSDMARRSGELVLAGIFGETACLSTLMEAFHRSHHFTYLADASISRGRGGFSPDTMHRSVVEIASLYSDVSSTAAWVKGIARKFGSAG